MRAIAHRFSALAACRVVCEENTMNLNGRTGRSCKPLCHLLVCSCEWQSTKPDAGRPSPSPRGRHPSPSFHAPTRSSSQARRGQRRYAATAGYRPTELLASPKSQHLHGASRDSPATAPRRTNSFGDFFKWSHLPVALSSRTRARRTTRSPLLLPTAGCVRSPHSTHSLAVLVVPFTRAQHQQERHASLGAVRSTRGCWPGRASWRVRIHSDTVQLMKVDGSHSRLEQGRAVDARFLTPSPRRRPRSSRRLPRLLRMPKTRPAFSL